MVDFKRQNDRYLDQVQDLFLPFRPTTPNIAHRFHMEGIVQGVESPINVPLVIWKPSKYYTEVNSEYSKGASAIEAIEQSAPELRNELPRVWGRVLDTQGEYSSHSAAIIMESPSLDLKRVQTYEEHALANVPDAYLELFLNDARGDEFALETIKKAIYYVDGHRKLNPTKVRVNHVYDGTVKVRDDPPDLKLERARIDQIFTSAEEREYVEVVFDVIPRYYSNDRKGPKKVDESYILSLGAAIVPGRKKTILEDLTTHWYLDMHGEDDIIQYSRTEAAYDPQGIRSAREQTSSTA